jgi:EAL domain-containing protein (putative c-di-GMP-specific phosphodiesterase class I)
MVLSPYSVQSREADELKSQEASLVDTARRIAKDRQGRFAVHIHLSDLRPHPRREQFIRIATRTFDHLVTRMDAQVFLLGNLDIMLVTKNTRMADIDESIYKLRALFHEDPIAFADPVTGEDRFCTWYNLLQEYESWLRIVAELASDERNPRRARGKKAAQPELAGMDPERLAHVANSLQRLNIASIIRKQAAVDVGAVPGSARIMFEEYTISVMDLQRAVAPDVNLLSDRWLFQELSMTLDERMLSVMARVPLAVEGLSLNLNIPTVLSDDFLAFRDRMEQSGGGRILVELQPIDIFGDLAAYARARARIRDFGFTVILDGMNHLALQFIDPGELEPDIVKIIWSNEVKDLLIGERAEEFARLLDKVGRERVLLSRCDSEHAVRWGIDLGVTKFQGRYIDAMLGATTMATCEKSQMCTLQQCVTRRSAIGGALPRECPNPSMLNAVREITAPKLIRPKRQEG